jgi:hypothetical protein
MPWQASAFDRWSIVTALAASVPKRNRRESAVSQSERDTLQPPNRRNLSPTTCEQFAGSFLTCCGCRPAQPAVKRMRQPICGCELPPAGEYGPI